MQKLTEPARIYCTAVVETMERAEVEAALENLAIACYEDDTTEDLVASYVDSVEAGDIEFDFKYSSAMQYPHHVKMLNLDIEDIWV